MINQAQMLLLGATLMNFQRQLQLDRCFANFGYITMISVGLGQDQSRLVKKLNRGQRGQIVDHGSILA